jgi:hypothetical protein
MLLRIVETTDDRFIGDIITAPGEQLGLVAPNAVKLLAMHYYEGRFVPNEVVYEGDNTVRLVNENYSVTLEKVQE